MKNNYHFIVRAAAFVGFSIWSLCLLNAQQPVLVKDINPGSGAGVVPNHTAVLGNRVFFYGTDPVAGKELWTTDGSTAGTVLVKDINPGLADGASGTAMTVFGNKVWFTALGPGVGRELWYSDGTEAGTGVLDIATGSDDSYADFLAAGTDYLYFTAADNTFTYKLWRTDGTQAGTVALGSEFGGASAQFIDGIVTIGNTAYFIFFGPTGGQLWKTDGTVAGTQLVKDVAPGQFGSISELTVIGNKLYFGGDDNLGSNFEPWVSDGTSGGTVKLKEINPNQGSNPKGFISFKNKVYFAVGSQSIWRTDGTPAGTELFANVSAAGVNFGPPEWIADANYLYFAGSDNTTGRELWRTDGTAAGTQLIKDLIPGGISSDPQEFALINNKLYFQANFDSYGSELGVTDGTAAGTQVLADLVPGPGGSSTQQLHQLGNQLAFIASHLTHGREWFTFALTSGVSTANRPSIELALWPNPATEQVQLTLPGQTTWAQGVIRIVGANGVTVWQGRPEGVQTAIDVQRLASGYYWLEFTDGSGQFGRKEFLKL